MDSDATDDLLSYAIVDCLHFGVRSHLRSFSNITTTRAVMDRSTLVQHKSFVDHYCERSQPLCFIQPYELHVTCERPTDHQVHLSEVKPHVDDSRKRELRESVGGDS